MVVCNTSPIFYLHRLEQLELLKLLFGTIAIPQAVVHELDEGRARGYEAPDISLFPWLEVHQVEVAAELWRLGLGAGETEAIALVQSRPLAWCQAGSCRPRKRHNEQVRMASFHENSFDWLRAS